MTCAFDGWRFDSSCVSHIQTHMENYVPFLDPTQTPVGSILHLTKNPNLVDMVNAMVRAFGFDLKTTSRVPNSFVVECDLTSLLTEMNIIEAKEKAQHNWVAAWWAITEALESLPKELEVPSLSLTTWDRNQSQFWSHPNTRKPL